LRHFFTTENKELFSTANSMLPKIRYYFWHTIPTTENYHDSAQVGPFFSFFLSNNSKLNLYYMWGAFSGFKQTKQLKRMMESPWHWSRKLSLIWLLEQLVLVLVGSPADLALIRIQADSTLPAAHGCIVINSDWLIFIFWIFC
jgi:hypothetical protein